jgi:16S rRNA (cytosine1402-N4)-methyltransferase
MSHNHIPVMLDAVLAGLRPEKGRFIVDGTFGSGGYSRAFLEAGARVLAFDRDPHVLETVSAFQNEFGDQFSFEAKTFSQIPSVINANGINGVDAIVLDIGVSSMQLDEAERGFSFMRDGPLDMRMSALGQCAAEVVNEASASELADIFYYLGEERRARHIANHIIARRTEAQFERTTDLAMVVEKALGGRKGAAIHPATRVFQALRIYVNQELEELKSILETGPNCLKPQGRMLVVSFHSLEDRLVKKAFADLSGKKAGPSRHQPFIGHPKKGYAQESSGFKLLAAKDMDGHGLMASEKECEINPRARSARLRVLERLVA